MTTHAEVLAAGRVTASAVEVELASVATAVPEHVTGQQEVAERAHKIFPQYARLDALYTNTGIERRYSVEPERMVPAAAHLGGSKRAPTSATRSICWSAWRRRR